MDKGRFGKGYRPDTASTRARKPSLKMKLGAPARLAYSAMGLMDATPDIRDQIVTSCCVGFAKWRQIDTRLKFIKVPFKPHSPMGIYAGARIIALPPEMRAAGQKIVIADEGCVPWDAHVLLSEFGVPTEESWPFDPDKINEVPPLDVIESAASFYVADDFILDSDDIVTDIKHALSEGHPVFFGTLVDARFEDYNGTGLVQPAKLGEELGGHAMCILGYEGDVFWCANSWGTMWGYSGFYKAGPDFFMDYRAGDFSAMAIQALDAKPLEGEEE